MLVLDDIIKDGDTASIGVESSTKTPPLSSWKSKQNQLNDLVKSGRIIAYCDCTYGNVSD
jgi:hypothetical protein